MPYKHSWYIKDQVIMVECWGRLSLEEVIESFNASSQYLAVSNSSSIHFIHDWSRLEHIPTRFKEIRHAVDFEDHIASDKLGAVIIFGVDQPLLKIIADLIFQLVQISAQMTANLESALAYLQKQDANLKSQIEHKNLIDVRWQLKGHVIYCHNLYNAEDIMLRNQNALKLIEQEGKPPLIHMLIDFTANGAHENSSNVRELVRFSTSSQAFQDARDNLIHHPLFGWVVVFGVQNRNVDISGKIIAQKYNYKRKEVDTLDDAMTFLKHVDSNIAQLIKQQADNP